MQKTFTQLFVVFLLFFSFHSVRAQVVITQWNFNSVTPDANTGTGSSIPSTGSGTLTNLSTVTSTFAIGTNNGGSTDPAPAADNSGYNTTSYAAQGDGNKTTGIQFAVSTVGRQNIVLSYDLRHSNTSSRYELVQYTTDITATTPVWIDAQTFDGNAGDTWFNNRTVNLGGVTALNNNPNAGFRIVSVFAPTTSAYAPSNNGSTYGGGGTWRFDMVTVKTQASSVSFVGTRVNVGETTTTVDITANIQNGGASAATADLVVLPLGTATGGTDYTLPASVQFNWPAFANNVNSTITITINNDAVAENAEYFIVQLTNGVNVTLPSSATNNFTVFIQDDDKTAPTALQTVTLNHIASFSNGAAGTNSAEIVAHDPASQRLFIANSIGAKLDIVNFSNPSSASLINSISITPYGNINSIAVKNGIVAAAVEATVPEDNGKVVFFDINGTYINQVMVGAMPDMIVFNNAGTKVLTANEGQPRTDYVVDPEGSVSIIDISGGIVGLTQANVTTASFTSFNAQAASLRAAGVRIFGLNSATVAQDLEPEYITLAADDNTAWVTCQENNAIAEINMVTGTVTSIKALGTKDHNAARNALDANDQEGVIQIANWPVKGLYMPDAIASYTVGGQTYLVTANEGDAREYAVYEEATRLSASTYVLDPTAFSNADALKANIGRLTVTKASGDIDGDGDYDEIHAFGARSFSIWNATTGALVWDSGDELEEITARHPIFGAIFNASNTLGVPQLKNRSDDKGPEPEGVAIAQIQGKTYAFVALERIGGCIVYDITDPAAPVYVDYKNTRNLGGGGDNGAEGIIYINAANSPTGSPIVILANEVSSTLSFFTVNNSVLDITLRDIKAMNIAKRNSVEWNTAREETGDVFELQRSKDGSRFTEVTTLAAKGLASAYQYWDNMPFDGVNYYRLKLKHRSGEVSYSPIVSATVKANINISVHPNPVKDVLTIRFAAMPSTNSLLEVVDVSGRTVQRLKPVAAVSTVDVSKLQAGLYIIRCIDGERKHYATLIKQ